MPQKQVSTDTNSEVLFQLRPCRKALPEAVVWQIVKLTLQVRLNETITIQGMYIKQHKNKRSYKIAFQLKADHPRACK